MGSQQAAKYCGKCINCQTEDVPLLLPEYQSINIVVSKEEICTPLEEKYNNVLSYMFVTQMELVSHLLSSHRISAGF